MSHLGHEAYPSKQYLRDVYNSVVLKDIISRNQVRDVDLLQRILLYLIANIGTSFSANSIVKYLKSQGKKTSVETVANYIQFCRDAFLLFEVKREDLQGKRILASDEKYYLVDHGIRQAIYGQNQRDINLVLENIAYMELIRRGYEVYVGKLGQNEIDFVCKKNGNSIYIQVCYLLASEETIEREFGALEKIDDNYPKYVMSLDEFSMDRKGVLHRNILDFLLGDEI